MAVTAYNSNEVEEPAAKVGIKKVLFKPVDMHKLTEVIKLYYNTSIPFEMQRI